MAAEDSASASSSSSSDGAAASVAAEFVSFLNASPSHFHAVHEAMIMLESEGYEKLSEREEWNEKLKKGGKYFFTRNHSTIIAFAIGQKYTPGNAFMIVGAHTDSPCPKLKPVSKVTKGGFLGIGVQTYGSGLWHTWFDRDLTVAGRVLIKRGADENASFSHKLVRVQNPILRIPTLAIHLDRTVNEGFKFNTQAHLAPILATVIKSELSKEKATSKERDSNAQATNNSDRGSHDIHHSLLLELLSQEMECKPEEISDFELNVCDTQPSVIGGALKEFIFSGRLDNLCMSFCSLKALIDSTKPDALSHEEGVRMVALFDHEEVGSDSAQGAGSPAMFDSLKRITQSFATAPVGTLFAPINNSKGSVEKAIQKSFLVSADMAHSLHPNYPDKHEENHQPKMHKGLVIKHNANQRYATNAVTAFIFRQIGKKHNIPVQDFVVRNDMACGSTIGPILASGIGIRTVDVGAPQLSMHSIREMCGVDDVGYAYRHFKAFFEDFSEINSKIDVDI